MLTPQTKRIGGYDYTVTPLDAVRGSRALVRLAKVLAPAAGTASPSGDVQAMGAMALASIGDRLSEADVDYFRDLFAGVTAVSGSEFGENAPQLKDIFPIHFAQKYKEMGEWFIFCLEVNFGSFFKGLGATKKADAPGPQEPPRPA